jgi:MFS family permease
MFLSAFMISDNKPILGINLRHSFAKLKEIVVTSIKYSTKHKVLLWVLLGGAVFSLAMQPLNMYWAPKFNTMLGDKIYLMGWIWATLSILALAGSYMTKVLVQNEKKYSFIVALSILTIFVSILISSSFYIIAISLAGYLVHEIGRGLYQPIQLAYMNNYADKEKRATIISFESMTSSFGAVIGLIVFGLIAQKTSIETTWFIASFAVLLALPFYFKADAT